MLDLVASIVAVMALEDIDVCVNPRTLLKECFRLRFNSIDKMSE